MARYGFIVSNSPSGALRVDLCNDRFDRGVLDKQVMNPITADDTGDQIRNADLLRIESHAKPFLVALDEPGVGIG